MTGRCQLWERSGPPWWVQDVSCFRDINVSEHLGTKIQQGKRAHDQRGAARPPQLAAGPDRQPGVWGSASALVFLASEAGREAQLSLDSSQ